MGSNDGSSIRMVRKKHKNVKIVAIDPIVKAKNLDSRSLYLCCALGDVAQSTRIFVPRVRKRHVLSQYSSLDSQSVIDNLLQDVRIHAFEIELLERDLEIRTMDSLLLDPDFVKIDVEGFELEVMRGASNTFKTHQPIVLVELLSQTAFNAADMFLTDLGYSQLLVLKHRFFQSKLVLSGGTHSYKRDVWNYVWVNHEAWKLFNGKLVRK